MCPILKVPLFLKEPGFYDFKIGFGAAPKWYKYTP